MKRDLLVWLRRMHGWFGLWGAVLGLLFGTAGIWLNHRAVLKIPMDQQRSERQLTLPDTAPDSPAAMAAWLAQTLELPRPANQTRVEPARPTPWRLPDGQVAMQPEHWTFHFGSPNGLVQADWWRGNPAVHVTTTRNGVAATLANLHKGVAMPLGWILLVDTLAGSLVFLCASGVALWLLTHRRRTVGWVLLGGSTALVLGLVLPRL